MTTTMIPATSGWKAVLIKLSNGYWINGDRDGIYHADFRNQPIHDAIDEEMNSGAYEIVTTPIIAWGPREVGYVEGFNENQLVGYIVIPEHPTDVAPVTMSRMYTEQHGEEYWFVGYLAPGQGVEALENEAYVLWQLWRDQAELHLAEYNEADDGIHFISPKTGDELNISDALQEAELLPRR